MAQVRVSIASLDSVRSGIQDYAEAIEQASSEIRHAANLAIDEMAQKISDQKDHVAMLTTSHDECMASIEDDKNRMADDQARYNRARSQYERYAAAAHNAQSQQEARDYASTANGYAAEANNIASDIRLLSSQIASLKQEAHEIEGLLTYELGRLSDLESLQEFLLPRLDTLKIDADQLLMVSTEHTDACILGIGSLINAADNYLNQNL
ncbi:MAG: hypothetical protein ACOYJL_08105 [Tractidigestivibacter sp.]|jgi:chromosome segregation ATPase|uniref:hypothetical protein n=1 Tax=Tractidigestivibacter sp. TaxID=2847320 RepID=UPI003D8BDE2E